MKKLLVSAGLLLMTGTAMATKLVGLHVLDKDYLMIQFRDGEVHYRDSGTGKSAYLGHSVPIWDIRLPRATTPCSSLVRD